MPLSSNNTFQIKPNEPNGPNGPNGPNEPNEPNVALVKANALNPGSVQSVFGHVLNKIHPELAVAMETESSKLFKIAYSPDISEALLSQITAVSQSNFQYLRFRKDVLDHGSRQGIEKGYCDGFVLHFFERLLAAMYLGDLEPVNQFLQAIAGNFDYFTNTMEYEAIVEKIFELQVSSNDIIASERTKLACLSFSLKQLPNFLQLLSSQSNIYQIIIYNHRFVHTFLCYFEKKKFMIIDSNFFKCPFDEPNEDNWSHIFLKAIQYNYNDSYYRISGVISIYPYQENQAPVVELQKKIHEDFFELYPHSIVVSVRHWFSFDLDTTIITLLPSKVRSYANKVQMQVIEAVLSYFYREKKLESVQRLIQTFNDNDLLYEIKKSACRLAFKYDFFEIGKEYFVIYQLELEVINWVLRDIYLESKLDLVYRLVETFSEHELFDKIKNLACLRALEFNFFDFSKVLWSVYNESIEYHSFQEKVHFECEKLRHHNNFNQLEVLVNTFREVIDRDKLRMTYAQTFLDNIDRCEYRRVKQLMDIFPDMVSCISEKHLIVASTEFRFATFGDDFEKMKVILAIFGNKIDIYEKDKFYGYSVIKYLVKTSKIEWIKYIEEILQIKIDIESVEKLVSSHP